MQNLRRITVSTLSSERFFYAILILLAFQAIWFALSALYPMAFDENFHFGLIKIYAQQWSPFLQSVPPYSGEFGPLTRDNSYLYHYLMSFPYRAIKLFVTNQEGQIIFLRLINIGFFVGGFVLFRRLLFKTQVSRALIHFALLMVVLVPITPMLAAHINYDNLIFLLTPIILLLTLHCARILRQTGTLPIATAVTLASLGFLTSIVKYAFLPVFFGVFLYLLWVIFRSPQGRQLLFLRKIWPSFAAHSLKVRLGLALLLVLSGGLFIERYGVNIVRYHSLVPECSEVISIEHCSHYGPWARNYAMKADIVSVPHTNIAGFSLDWFNGMLFRLFFAINTDYNTKGPVPAPFIAAYVVAIPGIILLGLSLRRLLARDQPLLLFTLVIAIYGISIYLTNLRSYVGLGELTAVNGRYFIPLLPLIFVLIGLGYREAFAKLKNTTTLKTLSVLGALLLFSQGGGLMTFLIRSERDWYWQSPPIIIINETAKTMVSSLVIFK